MLADRHNFINITHLSTRCAQIKAVEECDEVFFFFYSGKAGKNCGYNKSVIFSHFTIVYFVRGIYFLLYIESNITNRVKRLCC